MPKEFTEGSQAAWKRISEYDEITLVYHDDADGICSASITKALLDKTGKKVNLICLEKLYPEALEKIHEKSNSAIIYCDLGSPHADKIAKVNLHKNPVVILDHHDPTPTKDPNVIDLNLEKYGYRGESDFSASTLCYLFVNLIDSRLYSLADLAVIGSLEIPGSPKSWNQEALNKGISREVILKRGKSYVSTRLNVNLNKAFKIFQILASVGYYKNGPEIAVNSALNEISDETVKLAESLEEERKQANKRLLAILYRRGLTKLNFIQWFDSTPHFDGMGVKVVGTFCSYISRQRIVDSNKYLVGFMWVPPEIPGLGDLKVKYLKASIRVPKVLRSEIDSGKRLSAVEALNAAVEGIGFADGHAYAASGAIRNLNPKEFAALMDRKLGE